MRIKIFFISTIVLFPILGCQTMDPIHTVESVDLNRFMGNWYVIASIPTFIEKDAKVCVGTDSLTSNWQLSIFEELKTIAKYQSYIPLDLILAV